MRVSCRRHLGLVLALVVVSLPARGAVPVPRPLPEYNVKAAFLVRFFNFVRWPEGSPQSDVGTARIGILGESPFGELFRPLEGMSVLGRPLEIKVFRTTSDLQPCHILFVSASAEAQTDELLQALGRSSTLTVGEAADFTRRGGMIRFHNRQSRIALDINVEAAERAGLKLSSKLLDLAVSGREGR